MGGYGGKGAYGWANAAHHTELAQLLMARAPRDAQADAEAGQSESHAPEGQSEWIESSSKPSGLGSAKTTLEGMRSELERHGLHGTEHLEKAREERGKEGEGGRRGTEMGSMRGRGRGKAEEEGERKGEAGAGAEAEEEAEEERGSGRGKT
ncbi:MAG: hypothetical protein SGPRY_004015 [Prymnesium sp.]